MYTQCSHCRAVFRVTMKELTAAQGLLRCSECDTIFDAMKSLSTSMPDEYGNSAAIPPADTAIKLRASKANKSNKELDSTTVFANPKTARSRKLLYLSLAILGLILVLQALYSSRHLLYSNPATANFAKTACDKIGCDLELPRSLESIKLLSHNVYTHPNSPGVLIISASIQNNASFEQPYPILEISFSNPSLEIVALRRFTPTEYLGETRAEELMPPDKPLEFSINIEDPGDDSIRFNFSFL